MVLLTEEAQAMIAARARLLLAFVNPSGQDLLDLSLLWYRVVPRLLPRPLPPCLPRALRIFNVPWDPFLGRCKVFADFSQQTFFG